MSNKFLDDTNSKIFGKDYIKILTAELIKHKKKSSGSLIKSLDSRVQSTAEVISIYLDGNDYLKFVDEGRKAGSYPNLKAISNWVKIKGISQEAVFPIANKIYKFGIKPTNVIQSTINIIERDETKYEKVIAENSEELLYNNIVKELNKIK